MKFITAREAAEKWNISDRRVRLLCQQGKIEGVIQNGRAYLIPDNAPKPADGRTTRHKLIPELYAADFARIDAKLQELNRCRPLTQGELQRMRDEFLVEYTYNSNAIEGNTLTLQETALVLEGLTIDQKPLKDHLEAVGHRDAFLYVQQLVADKTPLSERVIKEIHSLVLMDRREDRGVCRDCPHRHRCTESRNCQKVVTKHIWQRFVEMAEDFRHSPQGKLSYSMRSETIERVFADGKENHGLRYTLLRRLERVRNSIRLKFAAMNLKKMAMWA